MATTSDATKTYLNEGVREFAKRVHGVDTDAFIDINPRFHIGADFAVKFTLAGNINTYGSADIQIATGTALYDATPTSVLNTFVSNVNGTIGSLTISMGWNASTWSFIIYGPASTTLCAVASPTFIGYTDGLAQMFGAAFSKRGGSITFSTAVAEDLNVDSSLPAGFLEMNNVFYGTRELSPAPFDMFLRPRSVGTPAYYAIRNKQIYLYPTPVKQDYFRIFYAGSPTDLGTDGSSDAVACPLPEEVHMAPVYYAAASLLEESHEFDKSIYYQRKFNDFCNDFRIREANNNPTLFPDRPPYSMPLVTMASI
jgi:hypothetical protein